MEKYISKSALVAEMERRRESNAKERYFGRLVEDNYFLSFIDTLEVKEAQEEPVSDDFEKALAREWKGYNDRGAATVDALEDNTQELAFAKGFYRGAEWGKNQAMAEIQSQSMALAHGCLKESITEDLGEYINELPKAMNDET